MFGGLQKRKPKTVTPVPPGTALHQLNSVLPTGRVLDSGTDSGMVSFSSGCLILLIAVSGKL